MPHQYKRRTLDEAAQLAKERFHAEVHRYFTHEEVEEMRLYGTVSTLIKKSFVDDWSEELGCLLDAQLYYEYQLYLPSKECPYIAKYYARTLVSRDRNSSEVWIKWKPPVPEYNGP